MSCCLGNKGTHCLVVGQMNRIISCQILRIQNIRQITRRLSKGAQNSSSSAWNSWMKEYHPVIHWCFGTFASLRTRSACFPHAETFPVKCPIWSTGNRIIHKMVNFLGEGPGLVQDPGLLSTTTQFQTVCQNFFVWRTKFAQQNYKRLREPKTQLSIYSRK